VEFTSAVRIRRPAAEVFDALLDAGKVAACLPGSRLIGEVADGTYAGQIELRIGPIDAIYAGTVQLDAADHAARIVTLRASGRERAGHGSADAHVTVRVEPSGASARLLVSADLLIRGRLARYAPGAMGELSQRLIEQFAGNVERLLASEAGVAPPARQAGPAAKRAAAAGAVLLAGALLAALALRRRRSQTLFLPNESAKYHPY
jgi:uncharacterized protein